MENTEFASPKKVADRYKQISLWRGFYDTNQLLIPFNIEPELLKWKRKREGVGYFDVRI